MTTIHVGKTCVTLINIFEVPEGRQDELLAILNEATETTMRNIPGFLSANLHKSLDGLRVANYAQWQTRAHFDAMLKNPEAQSHMKAALEVATSTPGLYEVVAVHES